MCGVRNMFQADGTPCAKAWKMGRLGQSLELEMVWSSSGQMELISSLDAVHLLGYLGQVVQSLCASVSSSVE